MTEPTRQTNAPALDPAVTERCVRAIAALGELRDMLPEAPNFARAVNDAQGAVVEWATAYVRSAMTRGVPAAPEPAGAPAAPPAPVPAAPPPAAKEAAPTPAAKEAAGKAAAKPEAKEEGKPAASSEDGAARGARPDPFEALR